MDALTTIALLELIQAPLAVRAGLAWLTAGSDLYQRMIARVDMGAAKIREGVAIVPVGGSIAGGSFYGPDDYTRLRSMIASALGDPSVRAVLLDVNSPGGTTSGLFDLAAWIRGQRGAKPIWAIANDQATSAAYAIAAAADRVIATAGSVIGSIGVLGIHVDQSQAEQGIGLKVTEIASGKLKTALSPHQALGKDGRELLTARVSQLAGLLFESVSASRPSLTTARLRALEAGLFLGADAVTNGLADAVMTVDAAVAQLAGHGASERAASQASARRQVIEELGALRATANELGMSVREMVTAMEAGVSTPQALAEWAEAHSTARVLQRIGERAFAARSAQRQH